MICSDSLSVKSRQPQSLRHGFFKEMLVVDSDGKGLRIAGAEKLRGSGFFWGYNIFLNQRIKVKPIFEGGAGSVPVSEVKKRILTAFKAAPGWRSRGDFSELEKGTKEARTIPELIDLLKE